MFRRIVFSACLAGFVAGILLTAVQQLRVAPIILAAETYEAIEPAPATTHAHADGTSHEHGGWSPEDGLVLGAGCAIAFRKLA